MTSYESSKRLQMLSSPTARTLMHAVTAAALYPIAIVTGVVAVDVTGRSPSSTSSETMRTVHFVFVNLAFAHASSIVSGVVAGLLTRHYTVFLYRMYIHRLSTCLLHLVASIAYWFSAFRPLLCDIRGDDLCSDLSHVYQSHLVFVVAAACMQCVALLLFGYTYIVHRHINWERMAELEDLLKVHPVLVDGESCTDVKRFCKHWIRKSPQDIVRAIPQRARDVMKVIVRDLDSSNDGSVTLDEFARFVISNGMTDVEKIEKLWGMLSDNSAGPISEQGVRNSLYDLSFCRKRLAMLLLTDTMIVSWTMHYLQAVTYGACGVIALQLWGYDAFGPGIDLLKTYLVIVTYSLNMAASSIKFLAIMIIHRPYNIGDVLRLDKDQVSGEGSNTGVGTDLFQVTRLTLGYTTLEGVCGLQIPNTLLTRSKPVRNVSSSPLNDCIRFRLPISSHDNSADIVAQAVRQYALDFPHDVSPTSDIRCVWSDVETESKVLECYWTYTPTIHDTSMAQRLMFATRNAVMSRVWRVLREDSLTMLSSSGGAFNDATKSKYKIT
jgi:hypothetical protein